ncbi:MAG: histidine phosphatase family protein [Acidobacteria bacterium]|nr:histidine phosphatase family protein [Acidobacteriota bacterium]
MRRALTFSVIVLALVFSGVAAAAQTKTIILVRHAEKNPPVDTDNGDPDLSAVGRERTQRLLKAIKKYRVEEIYSTEYKRAKLTAEPVAAARHKQIQIYDSGKTPDLVNTLINGRSKSYLVVGHSNTMPQLANLLVKKDIFKQLADTEYGVIWVIKIKKGVLKKTEVLTY